jgi:hypothetical protein
MASRQQVIEQLVRENSWRIGAELGVYQGQTFFYLLDAFPALQLIGVDHWERTPGPKQDRETGFASYENKPMEEFADQVIARAKTYGERATIIRGKTVAAAESVRDGSLDFIFIDAGHDTESVKADIRAWEPKVRSGGVLMGHDINWPSVQRAVNAEAPGWVELDGHVWFVRKE